MDEPSEFCGYVMTRSGGATRVVGEARSIRVGSMVARRASIAQAPRPGASWQSARDLAAQLS